MRHPVKGVKFLDFGNKLFKKTTTTVKNFFSSFKNEKKIKNLSVEYLEEFFHDMIKNLKANETIVFCGAGISMHSGLPLANNLVRYILKKINFSVEEIETVIKAEFPFEAFIEILRGESDIRSILDIFDIGKPNTNHVLLAKLVKKGFLNTICTTNFDQLIEKALGQEGLMRGDDFQVFYKEEDLNNIDWDEDRVRIIKIHGSIEDKDRMAITLQQIANKVLSMHRGRVLEQIFSKGGHKNVLVLGYSCSDVFDISPKIESIRESCKEVLFIDHRPTAENKSRKEVEKEDITVKESKNPFRNFSGGKRIYCDTDRLIKEIWDSCIEEEAYFKINKITTYWEKLVDEWDSENDKNAPGAKYSVGGLVSLRIAEYKRAIKHFNKAIDAVRKVNDKKREGICLGNLSSIYINLCEYDSAIDYVFRALKISREIGNKRGESIHLGDIGLIYLRKGKFRDALEHYQQGLKVAKYIRGKPLERIHLGGLGIACRNMGKFDEAIEYHIKALHVAKSIGDISGEATELGGLGNSFLSKGDHQKAIEYNEQALQITRDISDKQGEGVHLNDLGIAYRNMGKFDKAIEYYEKALQVAKDIGDKSGVGKRLGNIGNVYYLLGDYKNAIEYIEKAIIIAREIGDNIGEGIFLNSLGGIYFKLEDYHNAAEFIYKALEILRPLLGNGHPQIKGMERNYEMTKQ